MIKYLDICDYPTTEMLNDGNSDPCALDTETGGATRETNVPIYYSWAADDFGPGAGPTLTQKGFNFLRSLCESDRPKIFHNAKFDLMVLEGIGLTVNGEIHDTLLMHALLDEHHLEAHRLKALSRELLDKPRLDEMRLKEAQRVAKSGKGMLNVEQGILHEYAQEDAVDTLALFKLFKPQLEEQGLWDLYLFEVQVQLCYKQLDQNGIGHDIEAANEAIIKLEVAIDTLAKNVYQIFDTTPFNLGSPKQLGNELKKHFPLVIRTKTGWKTDKETLEKFISDERIQQILAWKFLSSAKSKLVGYQKRQRGGRLYPDYRQTTSTGRAACSNPNLMNIPKQRGKITEIEVGTPELATVCAEAFRQVRSSFIAPPGAILVSMDYAQIEYKCFAYYSGSERLLERLRKGEDFHKLTCELVFEEYTSRLRHIIKIVNYGLIYGMGYPLLMQRIQREAKNPRDVLEKYEKMLPEMRTTQAKIKSTAKQRGYVTDVFGRRYRYQEERPHAIVSWLCQGTAANVKKTALYRCTRPNGVLKEAQRSKTVADIHDQLVFEMYPEDSRFVGLIHNRMEDFPQFGMPITVDIEVGPNLLDMQKMTVKEAMLEVIKIK